MKIEDQVLTIEQMNHLKEVGVEVKDTALCWAKWAILTAENKWDDSYRVCFSDEDYKFSIPTLTIQEILEMLPEKIKINNQEYDFHFSREAGGMYQVGYENWRSCLVCNFGEIFMDVAYNMLCWCAERGYLNKE